MKQGVQDFREILAASMCPRRSAASNCRFAWSAIYRRGCATVHHRCNRFPGSSPGNMPASPATTSSFSAALTTSRPSSLRSAHAAHPDIVVWKQSRSMSEGERHAFIERFAASGRGIGFAVLGGAFAEGIDLPGERLIGAFIATLGMPQVTDVNEAMSERVQAIFGLGHEYTYLYPGLQRVTQAAGRVIRSTSDRGTLFLIDDRYNRLSVRRLIVAELVAARCSDRMRDQLRYRAHPIRCPSAMSADRFSNSIPLLLQRCAPRPFSSWRRAC